MSETTIHIESKTRNITLCKEHKGDDSLAMENFPDAANCVPCLQKRVTELNEEVFKLKRSTSNGNV
jgi:hypothetical protein